MGKEFTATLEDGTERFAASMSLGRADLFFEMTRLLESKVLMSPSGMEDDNGQDEYYIDCNQFIKFFEQFWEEGWLGEKRSGFYYNWACYAAGMIENMTLEKRTWIDRNGQELEVRRYMRSDEIRELGRKGNESKDES